MDTTFSMNEGYTHSQVSVQYTSAGRKHMTNNKKRWGVTTSLKS